MKVNELFERVEGKGYNVDLNMSPFGGANLSTNIHYNEINDRKDDGLHPDFRRQWLMSLAKEVDPQFEQINTAYSEYSEELKRETEEQISQLIQAYKNMVYGLITLAQKQREDYWNANVGSKIPEEAREKMKQYDR